MLAAHGWSLDFCTKSDGIYKFDKGIAIFPQKHQLDKYQIFDNQ